LKERLVTLVLALGAFALFYAFFIPKPASDKELPALPVSTEIRPEGYQALWRWLAAQGIPTRSLRNRYSELDTQGYSSTGNVLVATFPQHEPARQHELPALDEWIRQGNTLLVLAALDDTPGWARQATPQFLDALADMTGLRFVVNREPSPDPDDEEDTPGRTLRQVVESLREARTLSIVPRGSHPLFAGVQSVVARSEYPASRWTAITREDSAVLALAGRADAAEGDTAAQASFWLGKSGEGQIMVMAFASPFSNALLGEQENARLFSNIVAWSRSGEGAVLFDDAHQGLVDYYDAKAFFGDPRLHRTLAWLVVLWLLYVLAWQRIRPVAAAWNPVDVTTFIKVTGGFLAGRVPANAVGQRLLQNFFNSIRQRLALPQNGEPVWEWLGAQAGVPANDLAQLRHLHARAHSNRRLDLVRLQNCLAKITGNLA
jgi:hypothetical protein